MEQATFESLAYAHKKKRTRKQKFLGEMDKVLPWKALLRPIFKYYPRGRRGHPPIPAERLLRIYFLQQWYGLSDPAMEDSLYDIQSMREFAGTTLERIPDETTICKFRHFLEHYGLTEALFEVIAAHMEAHGLYVKEGTIVDATIIAAPSSTKNQDKKRDPDMKQTKKGNQWYFGMKAHIGTDTQGRVHSVGVTDASVHDSQLLDDLLHGEEQVIYGDKAYVDQQKQADFEEGGGTWRVNRKAKRGKKLNAADKAFNRKSNRTRAKVEHAFGVVKHLWGYRKVRYKGLEKNAAQVFTLFALSNIYMARKELALL